MLDLTWSWTVVIIKPNLFNEQRGRNTTFESDQLINWRAEDATVGSVKWLEQFALEAEAGAAYTG